MKCQNCNGTGKDQLCGRCGDIAEFCPCLFSHPLTCDECEGTGVVSDDDTSEDFDEYDESLEDE